MKIPMSCLLLFLFLLHVSQEAIFEYHQILEVSCLVEAFPLTGEGPNPEPYSAHGTNVPQSQVFQTCCKTLSAWVVRLDFPH